MAEVYNMNIDQGADYSLVVVYKDSAGNAINISNYTARSYFKRQIGNAVADKELTTANGKITLSDPTNGKLTISLTNTDTALLTGIYYYDLEIVSPTGIVTRLIQGTVQIDNEVTV